MILETLDWAIETANSTAGSIRSAKTIRDAIIKTVRGLQSGGADGTEIADLRLLIDDLVDQLRKVEDAQGEIKNALLDAKAEAINFDPVAKIKSRYELFRLGEGDVVFCLRPEHWTEEPMHYVCTQCIDDGIGRPLHRHRTGFKCPKCQAFYSAQPDRSEYRPVGRDGLGSIDDF